MPGSLFPSESQSLHARSRSPDSFAERAQITPYLAAWRGRNKETHKQLTSSQPEPFDKERQPTRPCKAGRSLLAQKQASIFSLLDLRSETPADSSKLICQPADIGRCCPIQPHWLPSPV